MKTVYDYFAASLFVDDDAMNNVLKAEPRTIELQECILGTYCAVACTRCIDKARDLMHECDSAVHPEILAVVAHNCLILFLG